MKKSEKAFFSVSFLLFLLWKSSGYETARDGLIPKILSSSSPPVVYTKRGESARLACIFFSEAEPKVNWMRDGVEVRHDCDTCISTVKTEITRSYLNITPYVMEDFGDYECRVRNKHGVAKLKISLKKYDGRETKCEKERVLSEDPRKMYEFRPVCNDDGSYHEVQCSIKHDTCWCVNTYGKKTLDVFDGANGLRCFAPKDLSLLAIAVLIQGILVTLFLFDQILYNYTSCSVYGFLKRKNGQRATVRRKGYKKLRKEAKQNPMKWRPLPHLPVNEQQRIKRKKTKS